MPTLLRVAGRSSGSAGREGSKALAPPSVLSIIGFAADIETPSALRMRDSPRISLGQTALSQIESAEYAKFATELPETRYAAGMLHHVVRLGLGLQVQDECKKRRRRARAEGWRSSGNPVPSLGRWIGDLLLLLWPPFLPP